MPSTKVSTMASAPSPSLPGICPPAHLRQALPSSAFSASVTLFALFAVLTILHLLLSRRGAVRFVVCVCLGCVCEIVGYAGGIVRWRHVKSCAGFAVEVVCLSIAPVLFTAAIHAAIVDALAEDSSSESRRLGPRLVDGLFLSLDFVCFTLVVVGSALIVASTSRRVATVLLLTGLALQMTTLTAAIAVLVDYWVVRRRTADPPRFTLRRRFSLLALAMAALLLVIRCAYRVGDLCAGWMPSVEEETFLVIFDGVFTLLAALALCLVHAARIPLVSFSDDGCDVTHK
ncbi:hypothetical protein XA68_13546 [Ophiocordyceps unilateralis]|uniref:Uncharacterized protein n=1 Tax=Ophiocordyceps unilateralis TaxID=268505 RepID=A0A2A9PAK3_OPHUN|nr:hypothetical protein XA68_13546 [Ophiocordyceps unilateralis]